MNINIILNEIEDIKLRKQKLFESVREDIAEIYGMIGEYDFIKEKYIGNHCEYAFGRELDRLRELFSDNYISRGKYVEYNLLFLLDNVHDENTEGLSIIVEVEKHMRILNETKNDIKNLKLRVIKEFSKYLFPKVVCKDISNTIMNFL